MDYFRPHHGNLFGRQDVTSFEDEVKGSIRNEIDSLSEDYVLNVSEGEYIDYLVKKYTVICPLPHLEQKYIDKEQVLVGPEYLSSHWHATKPIERTRYRLNIPFEGDAHILGVKPSTIILCDWPNMSYSKSEIFFFVLDLENDISKVKNEITSYISTLEKMIEFLSRDINSINKKLSTYIPQYFLQRKENIKKNACALNELGIPLRDSSKVISSYSIPTIVKAARPILSKSVCKPELPDPCMATEDYDSLISSIQRIGKMMERYPETVVGKDEETLRAEFLAQLSSSYHSCSAVGEAFNNSGKTDIMVLSEENIVFVAECKLWKGPKVLSGAIDQLLSYLT